MDAILILSPLVKKCAVAHALPATTFFCRLRRHQLTTRNGTRSGPGGWSVGGLGYQFQPRRMIPSLPRAAPSRSRTSQDTRRSRSLSPRPRHALVVLPPLSHQTSPHSHHTLVSLSRPQGQLGACMGALALHLGSKFDAAVGRGAANKPPAADAGCEWVGERVEQLSLPDFPEFGPLPWTVPAIPRLLPSWQRLHSILPFSTRHTLIALSPVAVLPQERPVLPLALNESSRALASSRAAAAVLSEDAAHSYAPAHALCRMQTICPSWRKRVHTHSSRLRSWRSWQEQLEASTVRMRRLPLAPLRMRLPRARPSRWGLRWQGVREVRGGDVKGVRPPFRRAQQM